jgi:hypothetical protein
MKYWKSFTFIFTCLILGLFLMTSASCSSGTSYSTSHKVGYNRSSRIKAYKRPSSRNSFGHAGTVKKKYVIKK